MRKFIVYIIVYSVLVLFLLELTCQAYSQFLYWRWGSIMRSLAYYYRPSKNQALVYELRPNVDIIKDDKRLHINSFGIRDSDEGLAGNKIRVGILGDSAVFGQELSDEETIPALLQDMADPEYRHVKIFNFGVPGYNLSELYEHLRGINRVYNPHRVIYLLNLNDFALRNSVYEGADNGLYRMYIRPVLKSPWFMRKAVYRLHKGAGISLPRWYLWLFQGTNKTSLAQIARMADFARRNNIEFSVVFLPAGSAYRSGSYVLTEMHRDISEFLDRHGIFYIDPTDEFKGTPETFFTESDHLKRKGCELMTKVINEGILSKHRRIKGIDGIEP